MRPNWILFTVKQRIANDTLIRHDEKMDGSSENINMKHQDIEQKRARLGLKASTACCQQIVSLSNIIFYQTTIRNNQV